MPFDDVLRVRDSTIQPCPSCAQHDTSRDTCLQWWTTAITERQLERSRDRLQFVVEANRQHAQHVRMQRCVCG